MQSKSIEDLYKQNLEMKEPDHEAKLKQHINTLQQVAMNIKVAQNKYKKQYEKKHAKASNFCIGQLVLKKDFTCKKPKGGKLSLRYVAPFTIIRVRSQGVHDLSCHNGTVISATGSHLNVYRQQVTSGIYNGSDSPASKDVNPACTYPDDSSPLSCSISTDSTADGHFSLHGKYIVLKLKVIMI